MVAKEREDGVYVYTAHQEDALAVDDLGAKGRRGRKRSTAGTSSSEIDVERHAATVPAPTPNFDEDDLHPAVPVEPATAPTAATPAAADARSRPPADPLIAELERAVAVGDWASIEEKLFANAPSVDAMPARLRLLWSVAQKESGAERPGTQPDALAIAATAELLGLEPRSPLALVVAKRLLRRRAITQRPAPKPFISWIIVLVAIAIGAAVGILLS